MMSSLRATEGSWERAAAAAPSGAGAAPVISGKSATRLHSSVPAALILVSRLALPPAIQERTWSAVTGPYSLPSPPMIVYMGPAHQPIEGASTAPARQVPDSGAGLGHAVSTPV